MRQRCIDPNHRMYHRYGGRGIKICKRWDSFDNYWIDNFSLFRRAQIEHPGETITIDRIDNNGDYEPGNVRFLTRSEHAIKSNKGRKYTEESRRKMSIAQSGKNNPMYGKKRKRDALGRFI